jgi:hypothetical protein
MAFAYHMPPTIQDKKLFNRGPVECGRIRTICEVEILFEFFTVGRKEAFRLRGGIAQLVERLVRNDAAPNFRTFSHVICSAQPQADATKVACLMLSEMLQKSAASGQNGVQKRRWPVFWQIRNQLHETGVNRHERGQ